MYLTNKPIRVKPQTMNAIYLLNKATPSNCVFNSAKKVAPKASAQLIPANTLINKYTTKVVTKGHTLAFLSSFSSSYKKNTSLTSSSSFSFLSCNLRIVTIAATPTAIEPIGTKAAVNLSLQLL